MKTTEEIVTLGGVANLTFDKVAAASGLSKGGIMYYFSSKNELVKEMVEPFVWRFEGGLDDLKEDDGNETGRYLRAYLRATFDEAAATDNQFDRLGASITAAQSPSTD